MNAKQILMLANSNYMKMSPFEKMHRERLESKRRYWHQVGSKCSHCKVVCDPQEVFCSDKCKDEYAK